MNRYHLAVLALIAVIVVLLLASISYAASMPPVFSAPSISCVENGPCTLVINKSAVAKSYSKLQVKTADGTAKAGIDYQAVNTILTIGNNTLHVSVPMPLIDNATYQGSRTFAVALIPVPIRRLGVGAYGVAHSGERGPSALHLRAQPHRFSRA